MANVAETNKVTLETDRDLKRGSKGYVTKPIGYPKLNVNKLRNGTFIGKRGGLYDPYIFGYANRCKCKGSKNTKFEGTKVQCKYCRCWVMSEEEYAQEYALYELGSPYISYLKIQAAWIELDKLFDDIPSEIGRNLNGLWSLYLYTGNDYFELEYKTKDDEILIIKSQAFVDKMGRTIYVALSDLPGENSDDVPTVDKLNNVIDIHNMGLFGLKKLSSLYFPDGRQCNIIGDLINYELPITSPGKPTGSRRFSILELASGYKVGYGEETKNLCGIMNYDVNVRKHLESQYLSITDKATYCWYLNVMINAHFATNEMLATSKKSLSRTNLDTRLSASIRALIVASLDLPIDTVGLPESFVYGTLQNHIIAGIQDKLLEQAEESGEEIDIQDAKELYLKKDPLALQVFKEVTEPSIDEDGKEYIPLMAKVIRNPSLHRWNVTNFKVKLVEGDSIHLPVAVDEGER